MLPSRLNRDCLPVTRGSLSLDLKRWIRNIPDYPQPGILFRDLTPLLANPEALKYSVNRIAEEYQGRDFDAIAAIEARGFLFGAPVAIAMGLPLVLLRKPNKLPYDTIGIDFELEYGPGRMEVHVDSFQPGQRILVVDDLLATGGTAAAAKHLIEELGASVDSMAFVIELTGLDGRSALKPCEVISLVQY